MKRTLLFSGALALALASGGCGDTGFKVNNFDVGALVHGAQHAKEATTDIPEDQEIALGEGIASNLLSLAPLYPNMKTQRYVNDVGRWISLQTERPDLPWTFAVLDDNEVNAFAAPGGYIVITKGLLLRMKSESELAGVLAHEMSHVLKKHHLQALKKSAGASMANDLLAYSVEKRGGNQNILKWASAGTELYSRGLDRGDELEADRMGVVLAARAGYEPYGLPAVLQTLQAINPKDASLNLLFKTHPPLADRLAALDKVMSSTAFDPYEAQQDGVARFRANVLAGAFPAKK